MTRENLEKANVILNEIENVENIIDYATCKNEQMSANFIKLGDGGYNGIPLHLNDELTHEILKLIIEHYSAKLESLENELENL